MNEIQMFRGEFFFLSNMYKTAIIYDGFKYQSSEAAYQAQKCKKEEDKIVFTLLNGIDSKERGRKIDIREDWDQVKVNIMREILYAKFTQNETLKEKLIETGDTLLIEGNNWNDTFWGVCNGYGENMLGKLLMELRTELINEKQKKLIK